MQTRYLDLTHQILWPPRYLEHHEHQGARVNIFATSAPPPLRGGFNRNHGNREDISDFF